MLHTNNETLSIPLRGSGFGDRGMTAAVAAAVGCRGGAAKSSWSRQALAAVLLSALCVFAAALAVDASIAGGEAAYGQGADRPHSGHRPLPGAAPEHRSRHLAGVVAEDAEPTLDEVGSGIFSRPPYNQDVANVLVYYIICGVYVLCSVFVLVGVNLDSAERRKRLQRAIVPQEFVKKQILCCTFTVPQESVPCEITEQYFLDRRLLSMRTPEEVAQRKQRMGLWDYTWRNTSNFMDVFMREHLVFSFVPKAIPTFTRLKRAALIIAQLHLCMIVGAVVLNVRENKYPKGKYSLFQCGQDEEDCFATVPAALLAAAIACPLFRYAVFQHVRLTCFVAQTHPSTSRFPLGMRKFASLAQRSLVETFLCMRNDYERQKARVAQSRPAHHRAVHSMWLTTRSTIKDLRFYSPLASWISCLIISGCIVGVAAYMLCFTLYLQDGVVYHWLVWLCVMVCSWLFLFEPVMLFSTQVLWTSIVEAVAQHWGYGSHALAATANKYDHVVKKVDEVLVVGLRRVSITRIQRWWLSMMGARKQADAQVVDSAAAAKMKEGLSKKKVEPKKNLLKEKKWCLRVEILDCSGMEDALDSAEVLGLFVRIKCDTGNPTVNDTKVSEGMRTSFAFNQAFLVDIKESNGLQLEVYRKNSASDEVIGRGQFQFNPLRIKEEQVDAPEGHAVKVQLNKSGLNSRGAAIGRNNAAVVNLRVAFLDPLKDACDPAEGEEDWMLPKNRMKFALSKAGPGGKVRVGKMLGSMGPRSADASAEEKRASLLAPRGTVVAKGGSKPGSVAGSKPGSAEGGTKAASGGRSWLADNSELLQLQADLSAGLTYRRSKDAEDLVTPERHVPWGSSVQGVDAGDGWLEVADAGGVLFLPMQLEGLFVLKLATGAAGAPQVRPASAAAMVLEEVVDGAAAAGDTPVASPVGLGSRPPSVGLASGRGSSRAGSAALSAHSKGPQADDPSPRAAGSAQTSRPTSSLAASGSVAPPQKAFKVGPAAKFASAALGVKAGVVISKGATKFAISKKPDASTPSEVVSLTPQVATGSQGPDELQPFPGFVPEDPNDLYM